MDFYSPRKLVFKAWNKETRLLTRLDEIECVRGELRKKDHVLLQFTGLYDKQQEELYELDIVLKGTEKYIIQWKVQLSGWFLAQLDCPEIYEPMRLENASQTTRLCNHFESATRA